MASVLVLGMGNVLKGDDGLGVHALRRLAGEGLKGADMLELGTSLADCFSLLEGYDVIVALDAVMAGGAPGSLYRLSRRELVREGFPCTSATCWTRWTLPRCGAGVPYCMWRAWNPSMCRRGAWSFPRRYGSTWGDT